jgi:DNA-binding NtrC family response regulator
MGSAHRPAVLVIDDDAVVRGVLVAMVEHHGYAAHLAGGGDEGVRVYERRRGEIAAVVLDVQMPGKDGPATLTELRELTPALPCVFVTGFSPRYTPAELAGRGAVVLSKPVALGALGRALRDATGGGLPGRAGPGADDTVPDHPPLPPG